MKVLNIIIRQFSSSYLKTLFKALVCLDAFVHISEICLLYFILSSKETPNTFIDEFDTIV